MKKNSLKSILIIGLALFAAPVFAVNIENFSVIPDGNQFLEFSWDKLSNNDIDLESDYGLQWSDNLGDIRIDKEINATTPTTNERFRMRGDFVFEKNTDYYARVYGYARGIDSRTTILTKGSKILKFRWLSGGSIQTSMLEPNDPTIVNTNAATTVAQKFSRLTSTPYDKSVQLAWSSVNEIFDEYQIVVSPNADLSNPVADFEVVKNQTRTLITGLIPGRRYHAAGYLKRSGRLLGKSDVISFTTLPEFDEDTQRRYEKYVLNRKRYGFLFNIGGDNSTSTSTNSTTSSSSSASSNTSNVSTVATRTARIAELKRLISRYQSELATLERNTRTTSSRSRQSLRTRTSSTNSSSTTSSLRNRLLNWRSRR